MSEVLGNLIVEIRGLRSRRGRVLVALFDRGAGFPLDLDLAHRSERAYIDDEASLEVVFYDIAPGKYAVAVLHDEDDDGRLSTDIFGIPTDGLGVSNFHASGYRRSGFEAAAFTFTGGELPVNVQMKYMD
jgi:uncharacterized protein (DUF2141 family)